MTIEWEPVAASSLAIGVGATLVMDVWAVIMKRVFAVPALNYAVVGRWMLSLPSGRFVHPGIAAAVPRTGEGMIGWGAHYAIGVLFAALLLAVVGPDWAAGPTLLPALLFGWASLAAPFFILQPGLGAGIAASKTPSPATMRLRSFIAHTSFGVGLYLAALTWAAVRG